MSEDNSQKDPQDTSQAGGTTPPVEDPAKDPSESGAEDQPTEPKAETLTEAPAESGAEDQPTEEKPVEEQAEPKAEPVKDPAESGTEGGAAEDPVEDPAEGGAAEEPATEEPAAEEPAAEEPAAKEPTAEEPVEDPVKDPAESGAAEEPTAEEPVEDPAEGGAPEAKPAEPAAAPTETPAAETPAATDDCGCPTINEAEWDKQKKTIDKAFYKTWSPRLLYYPFSFAIDISRATAGAKSANYTVPEKPMILDTGGMFWSSVMVEVTGENAEDKNVVSLKGKEVYTKVSKSPWKDIKTDIDELKKELGSEPKELYLWYTACPKCMDKKEVKTVLIAVQ